MGSYVTKVNIEKCNLIIETTEYMGIKCIVILLCCIFESFICWENNYW